MDLIRRYKIIDICLPQIPETLVGVSIGICSANINYKCSAKKMLDFKISISYFLTKARGIFIFTTFVSKI